MIIVVQKWYWTLDGKSDWFAIIWGDNIMEIAFDQFIHSSPQMWGFSVSVNFHLAAKVENAVQRKYFSRCKVFGNECLFCKIAKHSKSVCAAVETFSASQPTIYWCWGEFTIWIGHCNALEINRSPLQSNLPNKAGLALGQQCPLPCPHFSKLNPTQKLIA